VRFNQASFFDLFLRCFFAAFMLSTRFALLFVLNFVCRRLRGAGFFQGCVLLLVAIVADSLLGLFRDVAERIGPIVNGN
jgi:hypothetical protein